MAARDPKIVDLDAPDNAGTVVVVTYNGVLAALSRERLLELLRREESFFAARAGRAESASQQQQPTARQVVEGRVSHASLSGRIKKIYVYGTAARELRPTHAGFLAELLDGFDWHIPEHPTTALATQLEELKGWRGVSPELRAKIETFLTAYGHALERAG